MIHPAELLRAPDQDDREWKPPIEVRAFRAIIVCAALGAAAMIGAGMAFVWFV